MAVIETLVGVGYEVLDAPTGDRIVAFIDPQSGKQWHIPMNDDTFQAFRAKLGGLAVASPAQMPKNGEVIAHG